MKRALLYLRQSETSGEGKDSLSLDSQASVLRADAERHGWVVVAEIRDADEKGWNDQRPGLLELYRRCRAGDVDVVAFWSLSRLARSVRITENVVHELDKIGVDLHSNQESWAAIPMMRQVMSAFNEQNTRDIAAHLRRAVRERTRRGLPHGPAPFGYQRNERGTLEPSSDAGTVRDIFRWRAEGCSLVEISARLEPAGVAARRGGRWSRPTLSELLSNPVYLGTLRLAEVEHPDAHAAIITPDTFQMAQNGLAAGRERGPRTKPHRSWLEGAIMHACGAPMYLVGGSPGRPVLSFRCRVGGGWGNFDAVCSVQPRIIRMDRAEELTWKAILAGLVRLPRPRDVERLTRQHYREQSPSAQAARADAERRSRRLSAERERWLHAFTTGSAPQARFDREMARLAAEEREIASLVAELPQLPDHAVVEDAWRQLRQMRQIATLAPAETRGQILRAIGVAIVSPAGVPIVRSGPGPREDAGRVRLRTRPGLALFFPEQDT